MIEVTIEAGVPDRIENWGATSHRDESGYVHWPVRITVGDKSIEVDCWTFAGRAFGRTDLDGSPWTPNKRGKWRQLPTDRFWRSGMPRVRAVRVAPGTISSKSDIDDIDVAVEIGAGHDGPYETLTLSLPELRALAAHVDRVGDINVTPPDCSEEVCRELLLLEEGEKE